jgi:predicted PurR-regulated permease PerM
MARLTPRLEDQPFLRRLGYVVLALALVLFVKQAADLLLLTFGAVLGAVFLSAVGDGIAKRLHVPRGAGVAGAALLLFGTIGAIGWLFGSELGAQAHQLATRLPIEFKALQARWSASPLGSLVLSSGQAAGGGSKVANLILGTGWGAIEVLVNFVVILIGALFFAADPALYRRGLLLLVPPPFRPSAAEAVDDVGVALRLWLLTQIVSMVLMGMMIACGLWLAGLPSWGALGVLGGLSEFIPYVGPTLAMLPALAEPLAGGGGSVWGVLATYALVRLVQANLITPLVSQRVVHVPPGLYIFLILAMGFVFGTFGIFFSGALAVTTFTLVRRLYLAEVLGEPIDHPGSP